MINRDPVDRAQIVRDRQWRKSRVFHITYSTHYPEDERKKAIRYINDPLAGQMDYEDWKKIDEEENGEEK